MLIFNGLGRVNKIFKSWSRLPIPAICKLFTKKDNLGSIERINISNLLIIWFFKLLRSLLWRDIFWCLVGKQKIKTASGDQNAGHGDKMVEVLRRRERHRGGLTGPGGHSENLEARRSFLRGSWRLCIPVPRTMKSC